MKHAGVLAAALVLYACGDSGGTGASAQGGAGGDAAGGSPSTGGDPSNGGSGEGGGVAGSSGDGGTIAPGGCFALFDGVDDVLIADVGSNASVGDDFSIGAHLTPEPLESGEIAFVVGRHLDGSSNGFYVSLGNDGDGLEARLTVFVENSTCLVAAPLTVSAGAFVQVLGSYTSPTARVFIDGELAAEADCPDGAAPIEPDSKVTVGRSETGAFPYEGAIDEVIYLPTALVDSFDPTSLGCGVAELRYGFDAVLLGETTTVAEDCATSVAAVVGDAAGADDADPTFSCR